MTPAGHAASVVIHAGPVTLEADLAVPASPRGVVLFAHGSGSSRYSRRNRHVAATLNDRALATLLLDLLTGEEEAIDARTAHLRFDLDFLAKRLVFASEWLSSNPTTQDVPIGCFGASTGGGAALIAAAERPDLIRAVVSRGGRPDLAAGALARVAAPTLLIVGGDDEAVLELNRQAKAQMSGETRLEIVKGASHLFEEPGALDEVSRMAGDFFLAHLPARP
jgi:putative phosphoribosyl transferase